MIGKTRKSHKHLIHKCRPGFTLVEVLVVIMIVVVMAVLTLAVTRNFKDKAYQSNALNTMRQVAAANTSYAMDNNGDINVLLEPADSRGQGQVVTNSFWGRLIPYLFADVANDDQIALKNEMKRRLDTLFSTPDSTEMLKTFQKGTAIKMDSSGLPVPFAFNKHVHKTDEYLKTHSFDNAGQTLHMSYGFEYFEEADGAAYAPIPTGSQARTNNIDWFSNKTAAFVFLDGHVEILSPPIAERRFKDPAVTP
jgi:prepilin-type N-terminal cleavage/methylation domain-containing protein/prepilin-type processing-associated H-X9-DG protein